MHTRKNTYWEITNKIGQKLFVDKIDSEKRGFQIRLHISALEFVSVLTYYANNVINYVQQTPKASSIWMNIWAENKAHSTT